MKWYKIIVLMLIYSLWLVSFEILSSWQFELACWLNFNCVYVSLLTDGYWTNPCTSFQCSRYPFLLLSCQVCLFPFKIYVPGLNSCWQEKKIKIKISQKSTVHTFFFIFFIWGGGGCLEWKFEIEQKWYMENFLLGKDIILYSLSWDMGSSLSLWY